MKKYAVLCHPQAFRIYKEAAEKILKYEAQAIFSRQPENPDFIEFESIAGISYLTFSAEQEPSNAFFAALSRSSFFYALFEVRGEMLLPKEAFPGYLFEENMAALLHYQGKTNELFTRLMINLAQSACTVDGAKNLLDPVAGKGTTLYDALMLGMNACGIELGQKYFEESCHFAAKFMQKEKFKHTTKKDKILDGKSRKIADAYTLEFAPNKKSFGAKETGIFKIFSSDTRNAQSLIKKQSIDMVVGDLPYGIQHANKSSAKKGEKTRSADDLFAAALPGWAALLKSGGSVVFSFNEFTTSKEKLEESVEKNGLRVIKKDEFYDYRHMVDSSIKRNLVVAIKE